jgi:hypothetical protein
MHFDMAFHYLGLRVYSACPMVCFQNRDPALYQRFQTMMPVLQFFSFRQMSTCLYRIAILLPMVLVVLLMICLYFLILKTRDHLKTLREKKKKE